MQVTRISFEGARPAALLNARRATLALAEANVPLPRHEHVRIDGRLYIDALCDRATAEQLVSVDHGPPAIFESATLSELDECPNCGNVADSPWVQCPNCGHHEIGNCPACQTPVPRQQYTDGPGNTAICPSCGTPVSLAFNDPLWDEQGHLSQPTILVSLVHE